VAGRPALSPASPDFNQRIVVPRLVQDAVWALKPWPVVVSAAGHDFTIPALPAADWLGALMTPDLDLDDVLPGLLPADEQGLFEDLLFAGKFDLTQVQDLALEAVATVSARKWWVTLRLIGCALRVWDDIGSEMAHVDADRLSLAAWLDVFFRELIMNMEKDSRSMFLAKLEMPPVGAVAAEAEEIEMTVENFLSLGE